MFRFIEGPYSVNSASGWVQEVGWALDGSTGEVGVVVTYHGDVNCFYPNTSKNYVQIIRDGGGGAVHDTVYNRPYQRIYL